MGAITNKNPIICKKKISFEFKNLSFVILDFKKICKRIATKIETTE